MSFFGAALSWLGGDSTSATITKIALINYTASLINDNTKSDSIDAEDPGVRIQLDASVDNTFPVLYGDAYFSGNLVWAERSNDLKTMTYVLALAESNDDNLLSTGSAHTYTVGDIYMDGNRITFEGDGYTVAKTTDSNGNDDESMAGLIEVYVYKNNLGISGTGGYIYNTVGQASNFIADDTLLAAVVVTYNRSAGTAELPVMTFNIDSGQTLPGDVLYDYMTNTVYGAGIPAAEVDTTSLAALNTYGSTGFSYDDLVPSAQTGIIGINGLVDVTKPVMSNMEDLCTSVNAWLVYDSHTGLWGVKINQAEASSVSFTDYNIIGDITVTGTSLTQIDNTASVRFQNTDIIDKTDKVTITIDPGDLYDYEPESTSFIELPYCNKQVVAIKIGLVALKQARVDKVITFKTDYSYMQVEAGAVIDITSSVFGYTNKLFRVMNVTETESQDGIEIEFSCIEYDADVYAYDINEYAIVTDDGLLTPGAIGTPNTPTVDDYSETNQPHVDINAVVPSGIVDRMEFWVTYDTTVTPDSSREYSLVGNTRATNSALYTENDDVVLYFNSTSTRDFYVKVRGGNAVTVGPFSAISGLIEYVPVVAADTADAGTPGFSLQDLATQLALSYLLGLLDDLIDGSITDTIGDAIAANDLDGIASTLPTDPDFVQDMDDALNALAPPTTVPDAPTGCSGYPTSDTAITVNWTDNATDEDSYVLERSLDGLVFADLVTLVKNTVSYNDTSVVAETSYWYRIRAVNIVGNSSRCTTDEIETPAAGVIPPIPSDDRPGDGNYSQPLILVAQQPQSNANNVSELGSVYIQYRSNVYELFSALTKGTTESARIYSSDGTLIETKAASTFVIDNDWVEIPFATRALGTDYYILMDEGCITYCDEFSPEFIVPTAWYFDTTITTKPAETAPVADALPTYSNTITGYTPAGVDICPDKLYINFEIDYIEVGSTAGVSIWDDSDDSLIHAFDETDMEIAGGCGNQLQVNDVAQYLTPGVDCYVTVIASSVDPSECGISPSPTSDALTGTPSAWTFSTMAAPLLELVYASYDEVDPPTVTSPIDDSTAVNSETDIYLQFDQTVTLRSTAGASVYLHKTSDDSLVQQFDPWRTFASDGVYEIITVSDLDEDTGTGTTIKINPTDDMEIGTAYYLLVDADLVTNSCGYGNAAVTDKTTYNWTTIGQAFVESLVPDTHDGNPYEDPDVVQTPTELVITYDRLVALNTGALVIYDSTDSVVATYDAMDSEVTSLDI